MAARADRGPTTTGAPGSGGDRLEAVVALLLVACASAMVAVAFRSEISVAAPFANDHTFHFAMIERVAEAWEAGDDPRDPWIPYWGLGFPVLRYYQHLPHVAVVWVYRLLQGRVPLEDVFRGMHMGALVALPWAFYAGCRWLGMQRISAAFVALLTPLLGAAPERYLFGFQLESYVWRGSGLFPQEFAMLLLPLALGALWRAMRTGRGYGPALLLLSATWLCHLLIGYSACLLGVLLLLRPELRGERRAAALRGAALYAATGFVILYLLLPTLLESELLSHSVWEKPAYWDSFGMLEVLRKLATGALLDGERPPVLTGLALAGLVAAGWRSPERGAALFARAAFVASLLLYFGRPTWGALLRVLPFSESLPLHRLVCAVQFGGLLLAGLAFGELWRRLGWRRSPARLAAALLASAAVLASPVAGLWRSGAELREMATRSAVEYARSGVMIDDAMELFQQLDEKNPARGYAGTSWDGGSSYLLAWVPVFNFWPRYGLPAISYMFHTMGRNSDLETEFDPTRRDHYDLYNVAYHLTHDPARTPEFARVLSRRRGVIASAIESRGYFDVVGVDRVFDGVAATPAQTYELNKRFIASHWHAAGRFFRIRWNASEPGVAAGETPLDADERFEDAELAGWTRPPGRVLRSGGSGQRFVARVQADAPAVVLFRMTYHPGWRVTVDGREAGTIMLGPSYVGIPVEAGDHRIRVSWQPGVWTQVLFWLGVLGIGIAFLVDRLGLAGGDRTPAGRVALESLGVIASLALAWLATA